ncbi:hypothetical protein Ppa06_31260 [Planomonospora parontospora subsp. parontospora]|uniref:Uncharacterized protein n=2 Tax=Planomonospora parontospora TaxID=58119 RepID=A0AA37BHQ4_9ACTN|nr:hypothetical protein GCM10010126_35350 [Planomonospora parontospora]GII09328.1 hypothetical protein Ppa06_31260 [Planomonospora parontospora subsp. parontospora]
MCGNTHFQQEQTTYEGRFEGRAVFLTSRPITLMICTECRYILHFYGERSGFDFG